MSWVTVIWSMIASACLTLAAIYWLVWYRNRTSWAHLLFSLTAASTTAFTFCELWMMRAETAAELFTALRWAHLALFFWLVSIIWFVRFYLGAGRLWLAWTICGLRALYVFLIFVAGLNVNYREIPRLRELQFLGASVTVAEGVPSPWMLFGQFAVVMLLIFVADASVTAWRRGNRRTALMVGGSVEFFLLAGLGTSAAVAWGNVQAPIVFSLFFLGLVAVMGYELSHDVLRASQLVHQLQASEASLRDLSGRLLSAQEEERRRIARELHDNLSQQMALLAIEIDQMAKRAAESPATMARSMRELRERAAEISTEIRNLSHQLHSSKLEVLGLVEALRGHCQEILARGVDVHFHDDNLPRSLPHDVELCLFRIVQEGLNNVVKHSGVREAEVTLRANGDVLLLSIADLGRGFDATGAVVQDGLGLASMRERLRLIDGELTVRSEPGQGTTITVRVPIPEVDKTADDAVGAA